MKHNYKAIIIIAFIALIAFGYTEKKTATVQECANSRIAAVNAISGWVSGTNDKNTALQAIISWAGCTVTPVGNVKYRTYATNYPLNGAIALNTGSCGGTLTAYGFTYSGYVQNNNDCRAACIASNLACLSPTLMYSVPGTIGGVTSPTSAINLYSCADMTKYCVCQVGTVNGFVNGTVSPILNIAYAEVFVSTDADANKVSTSSASVNSANEVGC